MYREGHINPKEQVHVARLVGRKCSVECLLNGKPVEMLWDTGAQVSIISEHVMNSNFPFIQLRDIHELLGTKRFPLVAGLNLI